MHILLVCYWNFSNSNIGVQQSQAIIADIDGMEELSIANKRLKTAHDSTEQEYKAQITKLDSKENSLKDWTRSTTRNLTSLEPI